MRPIRYKPYAISQLNDWNGLNVWNRSLLWMFHTDGKHSLQVVPRIDAERNQSFRRCNATDFANSLGHYLCHVIIGFDPDDRRQIVPSGNRIDLADSIDIRDCVCDGVDLVPFDGEKNDG
jgi:hypothetical protein